MPASALETARLKKWDLKITELSYWGMVKMLVDMTIVVNLLTSSHRTTLTTKPPNVQGNYNKGSVVAMLDKLDIARSNALLTWLGEVPYLMPR